MSGMASAAHSLGVGSFQGLLYLTLSSIWFDRVTADLTHCNVCFGVAASLVLLLCAQLVTQNRWL